MSLVTRCPACSTLFKVVPDQIRIAAGWVRCGQCGEV
ncbi:MAG: zinc-ribbon domain-containing protein, partial [Proteobacteria bacterium]|nr:zinc-ribbon domain-containing protein [Pseudomonadota bacterium]